MLVFGAKAAMLVRVGRESYCLMIAKYWIPPPILTMAVLFVTPATGVQTGA